MDKEKISLVLAEFIGTMMLASVVLVVVNMFGSGTGPWYTALSAGAVLAVIVGIFGRISGAHVNPAVTAGLWTLRKIETTNAIVYIAAQILGGAVAYALYTYFTGSDLPGLVDTEFDDKIFLAEALGAAIFGTGIAAAVIQKLEGYYAAFTIGASLTFGIIIASMAAPGFLNPAVALANNSLTATYIIAPVVGMVAGMHVYAAFFAPAKKGKK